MRKQRSDNSGRRPWAGGVAIGSMREPAGLVRHREPEPPERATDDALLADMVCTHGMHRCAKCKPAAKAEALPAQSARPLQVGDRVRYVGSDGVLGAGVVGVDGGLATVWLDAPLEGNRRWALPLDKLERVPS